MKTSLKKLREFARMKNDHRKEKRPRQPMTQWDEIAQADQDMQDIKDCYDRLLSAAAAAENSAYEFSESLREIGDCLLEKTAMSAFDDEESGKVLLMLGKVQFELQRLVDVYRSHISRTITIPSESLLNELHTVEEMKIQCEAKRQTYEEALRKHKDKGKLKSAKVDCFPSHNLEAAREEYDQEANSLMFRMRSLKQGQCRSLLTQVARHHAAQLCFFRKAFQSLEAIDPHVKSISVDHHIDYQFIELEDDVGDDDDDGDDDDEYDDCDDGDDDDDSCDDGELSFDYRQNYPRRDASLRKPMEEGETGSPAFRSFAFRKAVKTSSQSAPLFPEKRVDPSFRPKEMRPSPSQKHMSYALPTPPEVKSPVSVKSDTEVPETRGASLAMLNLRYSSPLVRNNYEKMVSNDVSGPKLLDTKSVLRESNTNLKPCPLPPPLSDSLISQFDPNSPSDIKKVKRQAFSGPLTGQKWQNKPVVTASGPIGSTGHHFLSGSLLRPLPRPSSTPKLSSNALPTITSSPKISELHELPRPPPPSASNRPPHQLNYSEPLQPKGPARSAANRLVGSAAVSSLPTPPLLISRSYSIPSRSPIGEPMDAEVSSPPLTPIPFSNIQPASPAS